MFFVEFLTNESLRIETSRYNEKSVGKMVFFGIVFSVLPGMVEFFWTPGLLFWIP